jgi:site-specific recombinase XerD
MARVTANNYVHQRSDSNNFYYIRDVPKVARALVGKPRWKISLDTQNRAEANRRACRHRVEHDRLIDDAGTPKVDPINLLSADQRKTIEDAGGVPALVKWLDDRALEAENHRFEAKSLRDWANEAGPPDEIPDPDWADGKSAGHTAERMAIESRIARNLPILNCLGLTPEKLAAENRPFLANAIKSGIVDPNTITLQGVLDRWKEKKKPTAPEQYEYPVRLFEDLYGPIAVKQVQIYQIRDFRDAVQKLPRGGGPRWAKMTLQQMQQEAASNTKLPRIKENTAAKYFRSVKTIFSFAVDEGYIDASPANAIKFHSVKKKVSQSHSEKRRSMSPEDIETLLATVEAKWARKPAEIWFVRLWVYTGARPEELSQLAHRDVLQTKDGLPYLKIHDEGTNKLKSESANRLIPIHPRLLDLGFREFVETNKAESYLFPFDPNKKGRRYANFQRRLTTLMSKHAKIVDPRVVPYSIRHAFKDSMRLVQAPDEVVDRIMGHAPPERAVARGYGDPDQVVILAPWMAKVNPFDRARKASEGDEVWGMAEVT